MAQKIQPRFNENAKVVLEKRYLQQDETPEQMLERVSLGNKDYYNMMARLDFLPNSPTLFNCGTGKGTFSACFVFNIPDSMDGIMDVARKAALVQKWGGGVGYNFSLLRPKGAEVKGTGNHAGGPVVFLKMYNSMGDAVTQSGKRNAAQMGVLDVYHPDILEFINCKNEDPDALSTFNISVSVDDKFMEQALLDPTLIEAVILEQISESAWKTGDPGFLFRDRIEQDNYTPHLGNISSVNPCGEVPLRDNEPCNLGSINLRNMVKNNKIDLGRLQETTRTATKFLDDILDANSFPDPAITKAAYETRKLGLGVMGWADALALMEIEYASDKAVKLAEDTMKFIQDVSHDVSAELAKEKGVYPGWKEGSPYRRNVTTTCIAPTGTISLLAGVSSGIEPHFRLKWTREMGDGTILNEEADVLQHTNGFTPQTAEEIPWEWHVKHQAAFQKYTDLAVSKTINLPNDATVEDIKNAYVMMWELGCKGGTVFRDGCREQQVLRDISEDSKHQIVSEAAVDFVTNGRKRMPTDVETVRHKMNLGDMEAYLFAGKYEDGNPGELFITASKEGSTIAGLFDTIAILTSFCLQRGVTPEELSRKLSGVRFEPSGLTGNPEIPNATSPVDYIFRWLDKEFAEGNGSNGVHSGMVCSECHGPTELVGGCITCSDIECGWSRCG